MGPKDSNNHKPYKMNNTINKNDFDSFLKTKIKAPEQQQQFQKDNKKANKIGRVLKEIETETRKSKRIQKKQKYKEKGYEDYFESTVKKIKKQDEAVSKICNIFCTYEAFLKGNYFKNPRVLIHGPSGCGKTAIIDELSKQVNKPVYRIDASSLTGSGYKGTNLSETVEQAILKCYDDDKDPEEMIFFIDEIDKLFVQIMTQDSVPGFVINELLVFMEHGLSELKFSTKNVLMCFAGAFNQVPIHKAQQQFPEFFGRISDIIEIRKLTVPDFKEIILTSNSSPLIEMKEKLEQKDRTLTLNDDALDYIARYCKKRGTGTRAAESAIHELLQPYFGKFASEKNIVITLDDCKKLFDEFMNDDSHLPPRGMYI